MTTADRKNDESGNSADYEFVTSVDGTRRVSHATFPMKKVRIKPAMGSTRDSSAEVIQHEPWRQLRRVRWLTRQHGL